MIETMMLNRINESSMPETSCRRQLSSKSETKKFGNLRRKIMELRKMRSVAKALFNSSCSSEENDDCPRIKRRRKQALVSDNTHDEEPVMVGNEAEVVNRCVTSHGNISVIGRRREMEDAVAVELDFLKRGGKSYDFYGVYDGHGGWRVAEECREWMHKVVGEVLGEENGSEVINWEKVMVEGFRKMDEEVNKKGAALATTGSTAVVAVVGEEEVIVANCGDSRAVMRRGGDVVPLSDDHKPDRADELERIEDCGGQVINWNGQRVLGVLATSRSIGDKYLKPYVISEPEVKVIKRSDSDEFIVLASDGLWDVISNEVACQVTRRCLDGQIKGSSSGNGTNTASEAAAVLAELAMARGSSDNISVVVVDLKRGPNPISCSYRKKLASLYDV